MDAKPKSPEEEKPAEPSSAQKNDDDSDKTGSKDSEESNPKPAVGESFDAEDAMVWEDGIGHLPGSDFKVITWSASRRTATRLASVVSFSVVRQHRIKVALQDGDFTKSIELPKL